MYKRQELYISIIGAIVAIIVSVLGAILANKNTIILQTRKLKEEHYIAYIEALHNYAASDLSLIHISTLISLLQVAPEKIREERERQNHLRDKVTTALATLREREKQLADHLQSPGRPDPQSESLSSLQRQYTALQEESERILQQKTEVLATLHTQEENQKQAATLKDTLDAKMCIRDSYSRNRDMAHDLLQEGFIKVFTNLNEYSGNGSFEGWMRKIFINCALEKIRRSKVFPLTFPTEETEQETSFPNALEEISAQEMLDLIHRLPPGYQTIFNLFAIEGFSHKEIGAMLRITEGTSRSQYALSLIHI